MATNGKGPINTKMVDDTSHNLTGLRIGAGLPPMKDLKNQPNDDAMKAIRSMKAPQGGWVGASEAAMRQRVK